MDKIKISAYTNSDDRSYKKFLLVQEKIHREFKGKFLFHKSYFNDNNTPMRVCCKTHGFFKITPKQLLSPYFKGCPVCQQKIEENNKNWVYKGKKYSPREFLEQASNNHPTITIVSPFRGFSFPLKALDTTYNQYFKIRNPVILLNSDSTVSPITRGRNNGMSQEDFLKKARETHKDLYDYSKTVYISARKPILVTCKVHGDFVVNKAADHYSNGTGCPKCCRGGFNSSLPGTVYYISIDNGKAYKIGITNRTVEERFKIEDLNRISVIKTWYYENGNDARQHETEFLRKYKDFKYKGPKILYSGNTEMFFKDVLNTL
jgi:hypothetical protein